MIVCFYWLVTQALIVIFISNSCHASNNNEAKFEYLSFLLLGDWGKGGSSGAYGSALVPGQKSAQAKSYYQMAVAQAMGQYAATSFPKPSFVLALGDNFYANGVSSSTDVLWSYLWKNVYLANYPDLYIPWYPVFGNHDYGGSTDAQIQRFLDHSDDDIWMFESSYYLKTFSIPGGGSVAILFIDTTTLAPSENKCCNENGGISTEVQQQRIAAQLSFINESLASVSGVNRPTWLFVSGHYPVFSAGDKGDTEELLVYLLPLLELYEVDAYFTGHDHISEHLQYKGMNHFVAGAGSMTDKLGSTASSAEMMWYGVGYSAFAAVDVNISSYSVQFIDAYGTQVYSYPVAYNRTQIVEVNETPSSSPASFQSFHPSLRPSVAPSDTTSGVVDSQDSATTSWTQQISNRLKALSRVLKDSTQDRLVLLSGGLLFASLLMLTAVVVGTRRRKDTKKPQLELRTTDVVSRTIEPPSVLIAHEFSVDLRASPPVSETPHPASLLTGGRYQGTTIRGGDVEEGRAPLSPRGEGHHARRPKAALSNLFAVLSASHKNRSHYNRLHTINTTRPSPPSDNKSKTLVVRTADSSSSDISSGDDDDNDKNKILKYGVRGTQLREAGRKTEGEEEAEEDIDVDVGVTATDSNGKNRKDRKSGHKRFGTSPT